MRIPGVKLPPAALEKFYHANAERLIPGLAPKDPKTNKPSEQNSVRPKP
jgi:hypothetical protein